MNSRWKAFRYIVTIIYSLCIAFFTKDCFFRIALLSGTNKAIWIEYFGVFLSAFLAYKVITNFLDNVEEWLYDNSGENKR